MFGARRVPGRVVPHSSLLSRRFLPHGNDRSLQWPAGFCGDPARGVPVHAGSPPRLRNREDDGHCHGHRADCCSTNAWDSALAKVDFRPLTGVPVYLDTTNVAAVDQGWVVSSLHQAMLTQGVLLRTKPEQAQWIVEARVGAYGTDAYNVLVGLPQTTVPPTLPGVPAGTIPEMSLLKKSHQEGIAKLALFAYDRASGQLVWSSGTSMATSRPPRICTSAALARSRGARFAAAPNSSAPRFPCPLMRSVRETRPARKTRTARPYHSQRLPSAHPPRPATTSRSHPEAVEDEVVSRQ